MAYVTANRSGSFEIRESHATPSGPRSRTLATFRELDRAAIEKAIERAEQPLFRDELIRAALRAGAAISAAPVDEAARGTLRALARGEHLSPKLRRLLEEALADEPPSAAQWLGTSPAQHGAALEDLLLLADAIPLRRRAAEIGFPRIDSA
jgi:hypothetical protein